MTTMLINIEVETKQLLAKEAKKQGISVSALTRNLLKNGLSKQSKYSTNPLLKAQGKITASDLKNKKFKNSLSSNIDNILYG